MWNKRERERDQRGTTMAQETRKQRTVDVLPQDGGWGWMIVAGCFMVTVCTRAVTR